MREYLDQIADFIFVDDKPSAADVIVIAGSPRKEPTLRAAGLYREGFSRLIVATGNFGQRFKDFREELERVAENDGISVEAALDEMPGPGLPVSESEFSTRLLVSEGVAEEDIIREESSVNTFENAVFTRRLLDERGLRPERMILCCQAFHARRAMMTFATEFTRTEILVCPGVTRGLSRLTWLDDRAKYDKVLDELEKCGSYFAGERMYRAARDGEPASGVIE